MADTKKFESEVKRGVEGIQCACGGYAEKVVVTNEEENRYGCGRQGCCARAFVCKLCGTRWVGGAEAPEME